MKCRARGPMVVGVVLALLAACGGPPAPPEPEPRPVPGLVRRHFDQVCMSSYRQAKLFAVDEIFDTVGLGRELEDADVLPSLRFGEEQAVHFITHFGTRGQPTAMGVWQSTEPAQQTETMEGILRARVRSPGFLLEPTGVNATLRLAPWPRMEMASDVECLPHLRHRPGERPIGLPDTVKVVRVAAGLLRWVDRWPARPGSVTVVIRIDRTGALQGMELVHGDEALYAEAEKVVRALRFDPALRNGVPIATETVQRLTFLGTRLGGDPGPDEPPRPPAP